MKIRLLVFLIIFIFFVGCKSDLEKNAENVNESTAQLSSTELQLEETSRQLTAAIKDISEPSKEKTSIENLQIEKEIIHLLATEDLRIEGLPIEKIDTKELIILFSKNKKKLLNRIDIFREDNTELLKQKKFLESRIKNLENALITEKEKGWFSTFIKWFFGLGASGIVILLVLSVVGVPLAPLILTKLVNFLTNKIPQLIGFFGTVSVQIFDSVIEGVENLKSRIDEEPEEKTFTKKEVKKLISDYVGNNNPNHNDTISVRKHKIKTKR